MAGRLALNQEMRVQFLLPELRIWFAPGQSLLVVMPDSESGVRWFDSNPRNWSCGNARKSSGRMRNLSRKQAATYWALVGSSPTASARGIDLQSRGPAATTPGLHPGNEGSIPSGAISMFAPRYTNRPSGLA